MSEKEHLTAVVALMGGSDRGAYSVGEIEKAKATGLPPSYNEVHVMQRLGDGPRRTHLPSQVTQWRILVRSVAQSYGNAQEMRKRAGLLHEAALTVAGETFYVERAMSDDPITPDDDWFSGVSEFIY